ncbi:MAG: adenine phosphoribosyltransferase, partial [Chitinivibrionales bacterium]|nr:adenine phosphoribosyltransferase [Chitinivibrionales bacterium]
MNLDLFIRKVPDFPKPGILFYDVTSIFTHPEAFAYVVEEIMNRFSSIPYDGIIAIESRGFLLAAPIALKKKIPLVLARKKGKLPGKTIEESYSLEYGVSTLQIHVDDLTIGKRWLILDDLIATGGTIDAVAAMVQRQKAYVAGVGAIIGLPFLPFKEKIGSLKPVTLIE